MWSARCDIFFERTLLPPSRPFSLRRRFRWNILYRLVKYKLPRLPSHRGTLVSIFPKCGPAISTCTCSCSESILIIFDKVHLHNALFECSTHRSTQYKLPITPFFFCTIWSQVSLLIELHVSAVLFCFVLSSPPNHAEFRTWKIKMPLSQVKLFKPPVLHETLSIIQKTFLPTLVFLPYKSNKNIAAHWDLLYEFNPLIDSS